MKKNENKVSEPDINNEQVNAEETKKEDLTKTQLINLDKIKTPDIDIPKEEKDIDFESLVEGKRKILFGKYNSNRKINNILTIVAVLVCVGGMIMAFNQNQGLRIAGTIVLVAGLVGLLFYSILTRKKFPNETKKYIDEVSLDFDKHVFNDDRFKEMVTNTATKFQISDVSSDRVYSNISDIGSRNICEGRFNDRRIKVGELALYHQVEKRKRETVFVGKYILLENNLKFDGRVLINLKGEKNLDLPTDIEDLKIIKEDDNFICYGEENFDLSSILSTKTINAIRRIDIKENLVNVNIVLWGGHTAIYLSYEDTVVSIPFDFSISENFFIVSSLFNIEELFSLR